MNAVKLEYRSLMIKFNFGGVTSSEIFYKQNLLCNDYTIFNWFGATVFKTVVWKVQKNKRKKSDFHYV